MKLTNVYIEYLKNSFYKCLCLFEENNKGLSQYIRSFTYEIRGLENLLEENKNSHIINTLLAVLEHFYDDSIEPNPDISQIRTEVFRCMRLIEKLIEVGDD